MSSSSPRVAACVAALALACLGCRRTAVAPAADAPQAAAASSDAPAAERGEVTLWFPGPGDRLHAERRPLPAGLEGNEAVAVFVLRALLAGSASGFTAPLPADTEVGGADLSEDGVLYVDLGSPQRPRPPLAGSREEMLAVYSIVDSLVANLPSIDSVVLLWNGRQLDTYGGHVDTAHPLRARDDLRTRAP